MKVKIFQTKKKSIMCKILKRKNMNIEKNNFYKVNKKLKQSKKIKK